MKRKIAALLALTAVSCFAMTGCTEGKYKYLQGS